ncbi:DedA family protein [Corynebacterium sp. A21]|uniref:DedA family protein n=1 Tax=Corynebacterium sp. A21 TaxID=3457318 RepID=UPI003FD3E694
MTQNDEPEQLRFPASPVNTDQVVAQAEKKSEPELPKFLAEPERADIILFVALLAMGLFSLGMIPFRAWLLTEPLAYTLLVGGYTSSVVAGANVSVGNGHFLVYLMCTVIGAVKFMPIYWLMGKRWGMEFIDMSLQYMPRAHRLFQKAVKSETSRTKVWTLSLVPLGYLPGPVPGTVLNAVAGLLKVKLAIVLLVNVTSILVINGLMMWLGFQFGDPVLNVVEMVSKYLLWVTLGLLAVVFFQAWRRSKKK